MNFFFTSSGIDQDNYCALYMGDYGTYWIKKQNDLGISYTCN